MSDHVICTILICAVIIFIVTMVGGLVAYFARGETTGDFKLAQVKNRIQANKLEAEQLQIEKK